MSVRFNLCLAAVGNDINQLRNQSGAPDKMARNGKLNSLTDFIFFWECHGVLCSGDFSLLQLVEQVANMPEKQRAPVRALLAGLTKQGRKPPRLPVVHDGSPGHVNCCELTLVSSSAADGVSERCVPWDTIRDAPIVVDVWSQDDWVIPIGCSPDGIWDKCFNELAKSATSIAIVDPYLMDAKGNPQPALTEFMQRLDKANQTESYAIHIHTTSDQGVSIGKDFSSNLTELHVRGTVNVYMYPETWPRTFPRDRWVRLDDTVFKWHGIDTLTQHILGDSCDKQQVQRNRRSCGFGTQICRRRAYDLLSMTWPFSLAETNGRLADFMVKSAILRVPG